MKSCQFTDIIIRFKSCVFYYYYYYFSLGVCRGNPLLLNVYYFLAMSKLYSAQNVIRFMPMRGPIKFTIIHQIHVDRYISPQEMGETAKRWQLNMLTHLVTVQSHHLPMTCLWVAFVQQTSQAVQCLEISVGIGNLTTVL